MKRLIIITFIFLFGNSFCQTNSKQLIQNIDSLFEHNRPLEALQIMEKLVSQKDTNIDYALCKTKIGLIYHSHDSLVLARKWYLSVMNDSLIFDSVRSFWMGNYEVCGNYKHICCYQTAVSYYEQGDYDKSIYYYRLSLDSFPYQHFSGSDINKNRVRISNNIADLYSKKGDLTSAFSYLIPFFNNTIIYSSGAVNKAARIIKEHKLSDQFFNIMDKDFNELIKQEKIVLILGNKEILLEDYTNKNKTKAEIEEKAKYYWSLFSSNSLTKMLKAK